MYLYPVNNNLSLQWCWIFKIWFLSVNLFCLCDELTGDQLKSQSRNIPLFGGVELGYYYINAGIGKPFQNETLIVSTTQTITAFHCKSCGITCGKHQNKPFDETASSTAQIVKCQGQEGQQQEQIYGTCECDNSSTSSGLSRCMFQGTQQTYGILEDTFDGYFITDRISFDDNNRDQDGKQDKAVLLGCITAESGNLANIQGDGILGLGSTQAYPRNILDIAYGLNTSSSAPQPLLLFSVCISLKNGYIQLGGSTSQSNSSTTSTQQSITVSNASTEQYAILLYGIQLSNYKQQLSGLQIIARIDSGQIFSYLPNELFMNIMGFFEAYCSDTDNNRCIGRIETKQQDNKEDICFKYDQSSGITLGDFFRSFPVIKLILQNKQLFQWMPLYYLYEQDNWIFCLAIKKMQQSTLSSHGILGQSFMKGYDIQFDRENNRITLTEGDCGVIEFRNGQIFSRSELFEDKNRSDVAGYYVKIDEIILIGGVALGVAVIVGIIFYVIGKMKRKNKMPDEKRMIKKNDNNNDDNYDKGNGEQQQQRQQQQQQNMRYAIGDDDNEDNDGQHIEMVYKDLFRSDKDHRDDPKQAQQRLDAFQKFNFETKHA